MHNRYIIYTLIITVILILFFSPSGCTGINQQTIKGRLYVTGNEPFTQIAVETKEGEVYRLQGVKDIIGELRSLQGQIVSLTCKDIKTIDRFQSATVVKFEIPANPLIETKKKE
ncbi:MAG: hypothetical protein V3U16_04585 [Candidatus Neomarinimicrobiota bacterium]